MFEWEWQFFAMIFFLLLVLNIVLISSFAIYNMRKDRKRRLKH